MQWASWTAFFNMGGYAFYVWFSFGLTALCVLWEVYVLRQRSRDALHLAQLLAQDKYDA
jgi:heme exporter protein D